MYKVKHIPTGLYYQPVTSSGTNLGKKGKIYETTSSCLSGGCNYIILDIKKESPVYRDFAGVLESKYGLKKSPKFGFVYVKVPKSDFEKEYLPVDINTLKNIFEKQKDKYRDNDIVKKCLDEILEQITGEKAKQHKKDKEPNLDELIKAVRENVESTNRTKEFLQKINEFLK